jgi:hypothetical protein
MIVLAGASPKGRRMLAGKAVIRTVISGSEADCRCGALVIRSRRGYAAPRPFRDRESVRGRALAGEFSPAGAFAFGAA